MSNPWDKAEHSLVVLDYSKLLVGLAIHGAGIVGGSLPVDRIKDRLSAETRPETMIKRCRFILNSLTQEEKHAPEAQYPRALGQHRVDRLNYLAVELEEASYWRRRLWPFTDTSSNARSLVYDFEEANGDFTAATRALESQSLKDRVSTVLAADAAYEAANVELANLSVDNSSTAPLTERTNAAAKDDSPVPGATGDSGTLAVQAPSPRPTPEVVATYRPAVATTAGALLVGFRIPQCTLSLLSGCSLAPRSPAR